ncbi:MAG: hypothetical protein LBG98_01015 [Puniceicoccales bacterium]|jgi:hypothetical protein|nr:hypothetical protein [Puniceicoccales bacterium]
MRLPTLAFYFLSSLSSMATESFLSLQAPIQKFFLPMFTPEGKKQWDVEGQEATINNLDRVEIKHMKMCIFPASSGEWHIESPSAYVFIKSAVVEGRDRLLVQGEGFQVSGNDWQWFGKKRHLVVHQCVEVRFDPHLASQILK